MRVGFWKSYRSLASPLVSSRLHMRLFPPFVLLALWMVRSASVADALLEFDVTLVIQTSSDRLWLLEEICRRWGGPLAVAVFVPAGHSFHPLTSIPEICSGVNRLAHHAHFALTPEELVEYPVNALRNAALRLVATSHFLVTDGTPKLSSFLSVSKAASPRAPQPCTSAMTTNTPWTLVVVKWTSSPRWACIVKSLALALRSSMTPCLASLFPLSAGKGGGKATTLITS